MLHTFPVSSIEMTFLRLVLQEKRNLIKTGSHTWSLDDVSRMDAETRKKFGIEIKPLFEKQAEEVALIELLLGKIDEGLKEALVSERPIDRRLDVPVTVPTVDHPVAPPSPPIDAPVVPIISGAIDDFTPSGF